MAIDLRFDLEDITDLDFKGAVGYEIHESDYNKLKNTPIHSDTASKWDAQKDLIGQENHIYVYYTDEEKDEIKGLKLGDGKAYLIDAPFLYNNLSSDDLDAIVTSVNKKVTCYMSDEENSENLVFSKE